MDCGCEKRKRELMSKGYKPLLGDSYTALDAVNWAYRKVKGDI